MDEKLKRQEVRFTEVEPKYGEAQELPPHDRARLAIAVKVLGAIAVIIILAGAALVFGPDDRLDQATAMFDFVKTIAPPIVTLVLGFYFRSETA